MLQIHAIIQIVASIMPSFSLAHCVSVFDETDAVRITNLQNVVILDHVCFRLLLDHHIDGLNFRARKHNIVICRSVEDMFDWDS